MKAVARLRRRFTEEELARLIDAAPELYDAVWELLGAHRRVDEHAEASCSNCLRARAAIAKARGES